ncbi:alpha/beta hydrolase [Nocardioides lijunqiniae]|uniref:alpha/beta hydrolase n=1 Tax=Nocardioides lijunqiniae TaxID=2760832 RepID=UPI001877B41D|nr:alpha/beta hydrolase [Nocardioides lijunqiniae]
MTLETGPDVLGEPWVAETFALRPDDEGEVVATLVSRRSPVAGRGAVLHVHGFADYFFQTEYAAWWLDRGYDFYALDLRKYGRSILPHQTPNYVGDLRDYDDELAEAWHRITARDGHTQVVASAHSTGGLILPLWLDRRRPRELAALVLNSPWLDLQGGTAARLVGSPIIKQVGARQPMREIKRTVSGLYARSLHAHHEGEWDFDLAWKPMTSFSVYAGWLRAIREGHKRLQRGLDVRCPVLVLSSDRSSQPREMGEDVLSTDIVLDVGQIRRWSTAIGTHVTYVAVPGALHDVVLSRPEPRARVYEELGRWLTTYVAPPSRSLL